MSTHAVRIIRIAQVLSHNNADALEIIPVGGWQAVVQKGTFKVGDLAVYIEPDYVVPTGRPEFAFLDRKSTGKPHRLKAVRLRGELSMGLLIPVPDFLAPYQEGEDVMERLDIVRYEPPVRFMRTPGDIVHGPHIPAQKFDLENIQNYGDYIVPGEYVCMTEKLHGANARFVMWEGELFVGSRNQWLKCPEGENAKTNWWWQCYWNYKGIGEYLMANPGHVLYGEAYGDVQDLKYGAKQGEVRFAAFAIQNTLTREWLDYNDLRTRMMTVDVPLAPLIYEGPYHPALLEKAEEDSVAALPSKQLSEGLVIVPAKERTERNVGRVAFKYVSKRYWLS
jgi:RNA ligase (TIGR02306 family)